ncbi:MAG: hypothetical protein NTV26_07960 [Caldiserica bacterium]|nr:hypothetical protein [Caldisericota bacterium]
MKHRIFLLHEGEKLTSMEERAYDSEDRLQALLANYPELLGGDQMDETYPRRWLLVEREISIPGDESGAGRWHLDHLFIDQDGVPTLVEVKRATDTRIRREVVGQMLDYAANGVRYWPIEHIMEQFERTCVARKRDSAEELGIFLAGSQEPEKFWGTVKENLRSGNVRMLFVADQIPEELKRIVEFLNEQMDPAEVLAVEIKQFAEGSTQALVPKVIGQTSEATARKQVLSGHGWDEASFFEALQTGHAGDTGTAERLLKWFREYPGVEIRWGRGSTAGEFHPVLFVAGQKNQLCAVWTNGTVELYLQWMVQKPPFSNPEAYEELRERAEKLLKKKVTDEMMQKRPSIRLAEVASEASFAHLTDFFGWLIGRINQMEDKQ